MESQTAKNILTNALREIPGTRNWIRIPEVAQRLLDRIHEAGGEITFPSGEPEVKVVTAQERAFKDLVRMDKEGR